MKSQLCTWQAQLILLPIYKQKLPGEYLPTYQAPQRTALAAPKGWDQITLADICTPRGWNASQARRILRKHLEGHNGRWAWGKEQVDQVILLIEKHYRG